MHIRLLCANKSLLLTYLKVLFGYVTVDIGFLYPRVVTIDGLQGMGGEGPG